ncbi:MULTISPECIES: histone-like nucleoid-structuring protein MvaT [Pseudomonas]|uniref:histone-like nucleoid-structuring protein MvaT n=1 Tax=Pseudomonas TaxID=286 RepID=UPI0018663E18|nr:histone-like nucleoid-structuring protein MvaT [Pseudomonas lundensis]
MSLINEYRATEEAIKELQSRLSNLSKDERLATELEFEEKLRALMGEYSKSLRDIIAILDPKSAPLAKQTASGTGASRKPRAVKVYINPHTNEQIETKGGNHKGLKEWKAEYGSDEVEGWLQ